MTRRDESAASDDVIEQFKAAVLAGDAGKLRDLLERDPSLARKINEPWFYFDSPALVIAAGRGNRELVDALLDAGSDIKAKSRWWAGPYGVLHSAPPELAQYLIERGAEVDVHAAARLGMLDKLKELIESDPSLVNARGPDGQMPLHFAASPEIVDFLLQNGADIEARDVDHESTPAQWALTDRPEVCRHLLQRGSEPDIFMACMLGDMEIGKRCLEADPDCLNARPGEGNFTTRGEKAGGHIYIYTIGSSYRPLTLAAARGHDRLVEFLLQDASPAQRFLVACWQANAPAAKSMLAERPELLRELSSAESATIVDAARQGKSEAVRVMLQAGFDLATSVVGATGLHWACWHGHADTVKLLVERGAPLDLKDSTHNSTPLGWAIHGSLHACGPESNHPAVVETLLAAGAPVPDEAGGSEQVRGILRRHGAGD